MCVYVSARARTRVGQLAGRCRLWQLLQADDLVVLVAALAVLRLQQVARLVAGGVGGA